ncbi:zinc finger protein 568-like isoform X3 [Rhagoletis pomonella]|uniref:zinc finger protein 568-like isoform X3 n=1 Tax=Rhagoletis pomonella TaxID=28610 RepID=UPI00177E7E85|nr:zinc finger protein 568-like isoform X3 [Rhagoletis pomonella]
MMQSTKSETALQESSTEYVDLSDYCRLCLQVPEESQLLDLQLIYDEEENLSYYDCFTVCTQIDLHAGGVNAPHQLCKSCGLELQVAYDFHKKVEESKKFLMQLNKTEQLDEEFLSTSPPIAKERYENSDVTTPMQIESNIQTVTEDVVEQAEDKTNDRQLILALHVNDAANENEIANSQEIIAGHLATPIEYEALEEHIEMEDYQSVDELVDEVQMEYLLVEELDSVSAESILPHSVLYSNDNTNSNSMAGSTSKSEGLSIYSDATPMSDYTTGVSKKDNELSEYTQSQIEEQNSPPSSRACTPDLPIKIIHPHRAGRITCDFCQKSFPSRSKMLSHRRMHEPDRPRFNCTFEGCDRSYLSRQSFELHYKQTHCSRDDFLPFKCQLCNKAFSVPQTLEVHMRYHTREFPYECQHCHRRFGQKGHLTTHMHVKHNNLRYICPETGCGKVFKNTISLRNHSFSHTGMPFRCAYCDRGYPQKSR